MDVAWPIPSEQLSTFSEGTRTGITLVRKSPPEVITADRTGKVKGVPSARVCKWREGVSVGRPIDELPTTLSTQQHSVKAQQALAG